MSLSLDYLTGRLTGGARPSAVGQKFSAQGGVLPTPGMTTLCHIDPTSQAHAALTEVQAMLKAGPLAQAFAFLPPASFHMTVLEGVIDYRREVGQWPAAVPLDATMDHAVAAGQVALGPLDLPRRFRIQPNEIFAGFSVSVAGATPGDEASLRTSRDVMAAALGFNRPDHDTYGFHITLGYLLRWLTEDEARAVIDLSERAFDLLRLRAPVIDLGPIEYCRFEDMLHFEPLPGHGDKGGSVANV